MRERVKTRNRFGWTSEVTNPITDRMLEFICPKGGASVLDVGAAFGVATFPALRLGARVVANDIDPLHLAAIVEQAEREGLSERLQTILGRFPEVDDLSDLDAIHCSNVLHFLNGSELVEAVKYARRTLRSDGKLFIQVGTPYAGHVRSFLPEYEKRVREGVAWPGEILDPFAITEEAVRDEMPAFLHVLDRETLCDVIAKNGFEVELAEYYTRRGLPEVCKWDGRENLGVVASIC